MPFTPPVFRDNPVGGTPILAAELDYLGTQYAEAMADTAALYGGPGLYVSVRDFGAKGDGITDETAAFNAAIAAANALGGSDRENVVGITLFVPDGRYRLPNALNPITVSAVTIVGSSRTGAVLLMSAAGATFTYGDSTRTRLPLGFTIRNMKIEYLADPPPGAVVCKIDYGFEVILEDLQVVRIGTLVQAGTSSTNIASGIGIRNVKGSSANTGQPFINLRFGGGLILSDNAMFVRGVNPPVDPAPMTTLAGTDVIDALFGNWDTVLMTNCLFERYYGGIVAVAGAGNVFQDVFITNSVFDYTRQASLYLESQSGGVIATVRTQNAWLSSWESNSVTITGPGLSDWIDLDMISPISGLSALSYSNTTAKHNKFRVVPVSNDRLGTALAALVFTAGSTGFTLTGTRGNENNGPGTWQNAWGLFIGANCDNYIVSGNNLGGSAGGYNLAAHTVASANRLVAGNTNATYEGNAAITLPSSGTPWTNLTAHHVEVSLYGGTVTGIAKNGTTISGMTAGTVRLAPGETVTVSYSASPSATLFVLP